MKYLARFTVASALVLPLFAGTVLAQGADVAFDFRVTDVWTAGGKDVNGASTGHAVISKGRMRLEMKGNSRMMAAPGMTPGDELTIIMLDSGKTFIYLLPNKKQFVRINPGEMMEGVQKMMEGMGAPMAFDITGDEPKVENLGAGPVLLGHHTVHYRVTGGMKVSMGAMGHQAMEMSSVADEYLAPDIENLTDPFRNLGSNTMSGMFGGSAKAYMEKMQAARAKLPAGADLRTESHVTTSGVGQRSDMKSVREITGIQKTTASPHLFEVPAGYTKMTFPPIMPRAR